MARGVMVDASGVLRSTSDKSPENGAAQVPYKVIIWTSKGLNTSLLDVDP
jgi:hypothetical protein